MGLKTRERFIEVARQLFARKGVENTTMNDIASASEKGRRTIYTYFKSKRDIYNAVIEQETDIALSQLRSIVAKAIPADEKLTEYIDAHFETMKEVVSRNGSLRAWFFRDVRKVDRARRIVSRKEVILLQQILAEGVTEGIFEIDDIPRTALIITKTIQGLDVPYIRDDLSEIGVDKDQLSRSFVSMLLSGLLKR
ncbi:MAG: TetR family transcriptional regulator [Muribaculaceae bacterium]|nr:TetR family transcriptional regulator [Muribaculaceae bacterium]MDE6523561.1 TetR family transcriptional regulator [Muribaculaceae bacterium]